LKIYSESHKLTSFVKHMNKSDLVWETDYKIMLHKSGLKTKVHLKAIMQTQKRSIRSDIKEQSGYLFIIQKIAPLKKTSLYNLLIALGNQ